MLRRKPTHIGAEAEAGRSFAPLWPLEAFPGLGTQLDDWRDRRPFSVGEEFLYRTDSIAEPWSVHVEARVGGVIDEARLRVAVTAALAGHPQARARRVARDRSRRSVWEFPATLDLGPLDVVLCSDDPTLTAARAEFLSRTAPLAMSPPLRVRLARHPGGDVVMVNLNHAAGDGISALCVLRSIARAYAGQPEALSHQTSSLVLPASTRWSRLRARVQELSHTRSGATQLAPEGGQDRPGYGLHHVALTVEQTQALTQRHLPHVTVNDLFVAALHLAVDAWNAEHGKASGRIAVLMPVNLRPPQWRHEVVGNFSSGVLVCTRPEDRVDGPTALAVVARRTREVKEGWAPFFYAEVGVLFQHLGLSLDRFVRSQAKRSVLTTYLSNLGRVDEPLSFGPELGDATDMWFSAGVTMPAGVGLGVLTVGGRVYLSFRYRHPLLGPEAAARFADRYVMTLETLGEACAD